MLAGRPPLPLGVTRLVSTGDAVVLGEEQLRFAGDEVAVFAESRGVPARLLDDVGRWPALAELTASVGPHAVRGYVWEELLAGLDAQRRRALALLVAAGGADEELAGSLLGPEADLGQLLDGLPLVVRAPSGWCSLHPLWGNALQGELATDEVAQARRTAGLVLVARRQYHDAMELLLAAEAWDDVRAVVVEVCEVCTPLVPPDVLETWSARMPADVRGTPEGLLLLAMVMEPSSPEAAERLLDEALAGDAGPPVRYACLNAAIQLAFWRSDRAGMKRIAGRLTDLAREGHGGSRSWLVLLSALMQAEPAGVRTTLASPALVAGPPLNPVQDWLHAHVVLTKLGELTLGEALARRSLAHDVPTMRAVSRAAVMESLRLQGRADEAAQLLPDLLADLDHAKILTSPELVTHAVVLQDVIGDHDAAAALLDRFRSTVDGSPVSWAPVAAALARAFHAAATGDDGAAAAALEPVRDLSVVRNRAVVQISSTALPLLYVLLPEVRRDWDDNPPPGCFADLHALARALVAVREHGSAAAAAVLSHDVRASVRSVLPEAWVVDLAVAMAASGSDEAAEQARALLDDLGGTARSRLRAHAADAASPLAACARSLLREMPAAPPYRLCLGVLGPMELTRDGEPLTAPELRRERVRQLLGYLLGHEQPTRAAITADLWPDLEEAAAGRNLRVTLAYLQNLLEPDRADFDPPYFVRSAGPVLRLVADEALEVDAHVFERALDAASRHERAGRPSDALADYRSALALWRGEYLADVGHPADWLDLERDRLRRRFVQAAVRAGDLLLAHGDVPGARENAERALQVDRWCEPAYQLLVAGCLAEGDLVNAHRTLRRCQQMLRELGVAAQARTLALGRQLRAHR